MKLIEYMQSREIDDVAFAKMVGACTLHAVRKWKYGERMPPPAVILRIEEVTNRKVTLRDFVEQGRQRAA